MNEKEENEIITISDQEREKLTMKSYKRIYCLTVGHNIELKEVIEGLRQLNYLIESSDILNKNIINLKFTAPHHEKNIFIFDYGIIVLWSFDEEEEKSICYLFLNNCKYIINMNYAKAESNIARPMYLPYAWNEEENLFYYKKGEVFSIGQKNKITIESNELYERLAITYALAQETILRHYENEVYNTIEETKHIPNEMRDIGEINLSKKEISRNIGLIFMRRSDVNLNSDILDTPDFFWDLNNKNAELEVYYSSIRKYLDINKRVEILNKRMKILKELYDVMNNEIKTQGKFRLEWIVVYLIVIEIFVSLFWKMLVKDILKLY